MKKSFGEHIFDSINYILLILIMLLCAYPMLYIFNSSISDPEQLLASRSLMLIPEGLS